MAPVIIGDPPRANSEFSQLKLAKASARAPRGFCVSQALLYLGRVVRENFSNVHRSALCRLPA